MSQRDLDDPRFQEIVSELRAKAPSAREGLRERVGATARSEGARSAGRRWNLGLRRGLALAAAAMVTLGLGAALINGFNGSGDQGVGGRQASAEAQKTPDLRATPEGAADAQRTLVPSVGTALPPAS